MDEFTEMSKVSSLKWFTIDFCLTDWLLICRVYFLFANWKILIFFPFVAGNVLLTEDGTVKLGKAWDVELFFLAQHVFIISHHVFLLEYSRMTMKRSGSNPIIILHCTAEVNGMNKCGFRWLKINTSEN